MELSTAARRQVFWRAALLYLLITAIQFHTIVTGTAGFSYALDHPYVQLALAQHIAHGTYGINAGETASPVASVAWPFLLAPFAGSRFFLWVPLLWNALAGLGVCALVAFWIDRYFRKGWQQLAEINRWVIALFFVLAANLPALTLTGMEHTLQVLAAAGCAAALAETYFGRRIPAVFLVCAAAAPWLRYEGLAFTLAVCIACWLSERRKAALVVAGAALLPLLLLGAFLHAHGLSFIPPSVLTEGRLLPASILAVHSHGLGLAPAIASVNMIGYVHDPQRWPIALLFLLLCLQAWRVRRHRSRRRVLAGALVCLSLLMVFGPYGYFYRLDVAYRFFAFLLVFAMAAEYRWFSTWPALGTGALSAAVYVLATRQVPGAAWGTAHGQKQVGKFVQTFYRDSVLVTDPGWVTFDSGDRQYILAAESLGKMKGPQLQSEFERHRVQLAILSPRVPVELPPEWKRVAVLCRYGDGFNCTKILRSPALQPDVLLAEIRAFAGTLPYGTWIRYEDGSRSDVP